MKPNSSGAMVKPDRISILEDKLIIRILSVLETKDSVKTSVLSRRWKSLWTRVPTIDLSEIQFRVRSDAGTIDVKSRARTRFLNFVDRVFARDPAVPLEKVSIRGSCDVSHYESWIIGAMNCNVRELRLDLYDIDEELKIELPRRFFSCSTLVFLRLGEHALLNYPKATACFPNLKVLDFSDITYKDDCSIQNLISSCPVLEDLRIDRTPWDTLSTLDVASRSLKKLLSVFINGDVPLDRASKLCVNAPLLEYLEICDNSTQEYTLKDLSSLTKAKIGLSIVSSRCRDFDSYQTCLLKFLRLISNVRFLEIADCTVRYLSHPRPIELPVFHKLTRLEFFHEFSHYAWNLKSVFAFLNSAPSLEVLVIEAVDDEHLPCEEMARLEEEEYGLSSQWIVVPDCLVSTLKTIEIRRYVSKRDLELISYFLKNAKVLEKMKIETSDGALSSEIFKVSREHFPNLSVSCSPELLVISFG